VVAPGLVPTFRGNRLRKVVPVNSVGRIFRAIALDFPTNACVVPTKSSSDLPQTEFSRSQMANDISIFFGKMGVGHGGLLSGCELVALLTLPENPIMSCSYLMWCAYE